ncbi:MAG: hypothetical protein US98_C0027G0007 [Parcubacteria group bacterium GW2011_GWC1_38_6]|nr:MAG: hypothetical protein US98_C0027G0007 [Parcubacteria group bacterium GW2011_GWC1_38_6]
MKYWKILTVVVILLLLVVAFDYYQLKTGSPQQDSSNQDNVAGEKVLVEPSVATGNIDDAVNALLRETTNELIIFEEESEDAVLIEVDSQAISDFSQSYDEF